MATCCSSGARAGNLAGPSSRPGSWRAGQLCARVCVLSHACAHAHGARREEGYAPASHTMASVCPAEVTPRGFQAIGHVQGPGAACLCSVLLLMGTCSPLGGTLLLWPLSSPWHSCSRVLRFLLRSGVLSSAVPLDSGSCSEARPAPQGLALGWIGGSPALWVLAGRWACMQLLALCLCRGCQLGLEPRLPASSVGAAVHWGLAATN